MNRLLPLFVIVIVSLCHHEWKLLDIIEVEEDAFIECSN